MVTGKMRLYRRINGCDNIGGGADQGKEYFDAGSRCFTVFYKDEFVLVGDNHCLLLAHKFQVIKSQQKIIHLQQHIKG